MKLAVALAALALPLAFPSDALAQDRPDYADGASWLCRPDRIDACATDQSVTVVEASGAMRAEALVPDTDPAFDCFYVYPTVSTDPTPNSDMNADPAELQVAHAQAARFRQHCRVFAPLYRQVTLSALRSAMMGAPLQADRAMAFGDVRAAWEDYLVRDNGGRGVVLIGHSQGSGMLKQLLETMPEGERGRIVSALLIGTNVERDPADPGNSEAAWMPVCTSADQHGCLVSYVTFRDTVPPPARSRFGRAQGAGREVVCVNPAALMGNAASAHAIFSTNFIVASARPMDHWVKDKPMPTTGFTSAPGLIAAQCVKQDGASYLAVTVKGDPADPRTDDITGDIYAGDMRLDDWGLHLIDMPVVMGDLVALTKRQHASWQGAQRQ